MSRIDSWDERFVAAALEGEIDECDRGVTALWHAVYFGQVEWVRRLLAAGARLDAHDQAAIERGKGDGHLVSIWHGGRDHHDAPSGPGTLLHAAVARIGSTEMIDALLGHVDRAGQRLSVNARDHYGDTPLHIAAFRKDAPVIEHLVAAGADVTAIDRVGCMPLDVGWSSLETVEALLAGGAPPDGAKHLCATSRISRSSVIESAAYFDRADIISVLLAAGADLARHREALADAAKHGATSAVRVLLAAGADVDATINWRGGDRRALPSAAMYASLPCAELLLPSCGHQLDDALATAIELSSDDNPEPPNDRAPRRRELVGWLIDQGATPQAGMAAAVRAGDDSYGCILVERGADVEALDDGEPPLIHAARAGHRKLGTLLLAKGANPKARSKDGKSAYEVAEFAYRHRKIDDARFVMAALVEAGGGPVRPVAPAKPIGPQIGGKVTHAKFGSGTITALTGDKLTIEFASGAKVLLAKFVTLH